MLFGRGKRSTRGAQPDTLGGNDTHRHAACLGRANDDPDREMRIGAQTPLATLLAGYAAQCERYRTLVAGLDLEARSQRTIRTGEQVTLRWLLMHLIEEIARHNGHIDLLREMADGVTGT